jgi:hypothetical protein
VHNKIYFLFRPWEFPAGWYCCSIVFGFSLISNGTWEALSFSICWCIYTGIISCLIHSAIWVWTIVNFHAFCVWVLVCISQLLSSYSISSRSSSIVSKVLTYACCYLQRMNVIYFQYLLLTCHFAVTLFMCMIKCKTWPLSETVMHRKYQQLLSTFVLVWLFDTRSLNCIGLPCSDQCEIYNKTDKRTLNFRDIYKTYKKVLESLPKLHPYKRRPDAYLQHHYRWRFMPT